MVKETERFLMANKTYVESAKTIPVAGSYDVVVAGGGPAGIGAAWAAANHGAKTLLLEHANCLGGMAIPGMMSHWVGSTGSSVYNKIMDRCLECAWDVEEVSGSNRHVINHEKEKLVILDLLEEAGVVIQLCTDVVDVVKEGSRITGVITQSKSGRELVECKVVVDCTGDGDVAAAAGAEFQLGREEDSRMQPVTLMFKIAGVDMDTAVFPPSFESQVETPKGELQALARELLPKPAGHVLLYKSTIPGIVVVNMTNVTDVDGTDVRDLTRAEITCTRQIPKIMDFLHEYVPGYAHAYVISTASNVGVRETRHIKGLYSMTAEDIVEGRTFEDWIATKSAFNFDIHNVDGSGLDRNGAQKHFHAKGTYTIPYRCCVPVQIDGLLVAGRCISGTHKAHSNYRAMPICMGIGQGCGTAASVAVKDNVLPRHVEVAQVQKLLIEDGIEF